MKKNRFLFVVLAALGYGLWVSEDFKVIAVGVAIFLFGMLFLEDGFKAFSGGTLERMLKWSTSNLWKSHAFGVVSTSIMQSSSLISVITISFLSAGLIDLTGGIGIIFGANIGTTTGAWLMAGFGMKVNIAAYAMPMIIFGLVFHFQKQKELKGIGSILAGLGFLFLGIFYMKEGFENVKDTIDLAEYAVGGFKGLVLFAAIGVVATVVMQSSHATLMLIIAGLAAGQFSFENALALAIGANIGTTITAILGSIGASAAGKRLAVAHLVFNGVTAIIAIVFIAQFRLVVDQVSVWVGIGATDWVLKLAVFHTIFNVVGVLVMVPFIPLLVRVLERRLTSKTATEGAPLSSGPEPLYLNDAALLLPDTALQVLVKETTHLFDVAFEVIAHGFSLHRVDILMGHSLQDVVEGSREAFKMDVEAAYYRGIKQLYGAIIEFITRARALPNLTEFQRDQFYSLRVVCREIAVIIKDVSQMQGNVQKYMVSENEFMRREYNEIRTNIAEVLRRIYRLRDSKDTVSIVVALNELEEDLRKSDVLSDGTFDQLVRERAITPAMATSLMNDNAMAFDTGTKLIEIAKRMFVAGGIEPEILFEEHDYVDDTSQA